MAEQPTFEDSLKILEDAVAQLEQGQLPLDQALACFEAGIKGANQCRRLLQDVEARVEKLISRADGTLDVEALDAQGNGDA